MRWAVHVLSQEGDLWRAVALFIAAGALRAALSTLWEAGLPDGAVAFAAACQEAGGVTDGGAGEEADATPMSIARDASAEPGWGRLVGADLRAARTTFGLYVGRVVAAALAEGGGRSAEMM